jgi:hypothetical protein
VLEPLPVDTCVILNAISLQLNCSTIVKGFMFDWRNTFNACWHDFANLAILSFHDADGAIIPNTTIAGNLTILLPVLDGSVAACCNEGIHFFRVTCTIDFASLILIPNYGTSVLRVGFYIKLPQTMVVVVNGGGHNYNLTTWHGTANLCMLSPAQVRDYPQPMSARQAYPSTCCQF